jgi:hypothetical protein
MGATNGPRFWISGHFCPRSSSLAHPENTFKENDMEAKSTRTHHLATKQVVLSSVTFICIVAGAFAQQAPPDVRPLTASQVVILPLIGARENKKIRINVDELRDYAQEKLKSKQYAAIESDATGDFGGNAFLDKDLVDAKPEQIKRLGPPESRFVMVIVLGDTHKVRNSRNLIARASANGCLFDKETGALLWHASDYNHEKDARNLGAAVQPLAMFRYGMVMRVGLEDAISRLFDEHGLPAQTEHSNPPAAPPKSVVPR